jgi:hypothetical protein
MVGRPPILPLALVGGLAAVPQRYNTESAWTATKRLKVEPA